MPAPVLQTFTQTTTMVNRQSALPVVELPSKAKIKRRRKRIVKTKVGPPGPLYKLDGIQEADLPFTTFTYYHAIAKADLLSVQTPLQLLDHAKRVWCRYFELFDWNGQYLCLGKGMSRFYKSHSALAGFMGEGTTLLFMHAKNFPYWDHAELLLDRAAQRGSLPGAIVAPSALQPVGLVNPPMLPPAQIVPKPKKKRKGEKRHADFICENIHNEYALAEAKGGFVGKNDPDVKGDLRSALDQLKKLQKAFNLTAKSSFAVGTYLREASNAKLQPSLIVYADPIATNEPFDDFPNDWIRRATYGAWLIGMGFFDAGLALRGRLDRKLRSICLPVVMIGAYEFAFIVQSIRGNSGFSGMPFFPGPCPQEIFDLHSLSNAIWPFRGDIEELVVYGMELHTLKAASVAAQSAENRSLLELAAIEVPSVNVTGDWFAGSILRDGTLFGSIYPAKATKIEFRFQEFKLLSEMGEKPIPIPRSTTTTSIPNVGQSRKRLILVDPLDS